VNRFYQFLYLAILAILISTPVHSWDRKARQHDLRSDNLDRFQSRQNFLKRKSSNSYNNHEVATSDSGLQRPIESKRKGVAYHLGFSTKAYHTNNPISVESGDMLKTSAGVLENSLQGNIILGAYDLRGAAFSPIVGINYTKFTNFGDDLFKNYDFDSISMSFAGIFQFANDWNIRPSIAYNADFNPRDGYRRQFSQFSPGIAIGKTFSWGKTQSFLEWSSSFNFSNQPNSFSMPTDDMNRFETSLTWGFDIPFGRFNFSPYLRGALVDYSKKDRTDFLSNFGLDLKFTVTDWLALKIYSTISTRDSSVNGLDFTRIDTGCGASLNAKF